jgi:hypothetical protein
MVDMALDHKKCIQIPALPVHQLFHFQKHHNVLEPKTISLNGM